MTGSEEGRLRVLDLCSGLGGATSAFEDRGHEVVTVDIEPAFEPTVCADLLNLSPEDLGHGRFDFVWWSPPCPCFSKMGIRHHWTDDGEPKTEECREAIRMVIHGQSLMEELDPRAFIIENPVGKLRSLGILDPLERRTVTYCRYGQDYRKETDLWGGFPAGLDLEWCKAGASCHAPTERVDGWGARGIRDSEVKHPLLDEGGRLEELKKKKTGGVALHGGKLKAAKRSLVPYELSLDVCLAMEGFDGHWRDVRPTLEAFA